MNWRAFFLPPLVERGQGLYRPGRPWLELLKSLVLTAAAIGVVAFGQMYAMGALYLALAGFLGWRLWAERRTFGPLGRPLVSIHDGTAFFSLSSRLMPRQQEVVLREVKALTLFGDFTRRKFVFERRHGDAIRFTTAYGRHDERVVEFVRQHMPSRIRLEIKDAPAVVGQIPGDEH